MNLTSNTFNPRDLEYQIELLSPFPLVTSDVPEPEEFATSHSGKIVAYDVTTDPIDVGRIAFDQIHMATALNERTHVAEVLDALGYNASMSALLANEAGWLEESLARQLCLGTDVGDIVIIQQLEFLPPFRGIGLAKRVVDELFRRFAELALIVVQPRPRQFNQPMSDAESRNWFESLKLETFSQDESQAVDSLTDYFLSMGFTPLEDPGVLVRPNPSLTVTGPFSNIELADQRDQLH